MSSRHRRLSLSQARRMALAAQGFADPRPAGGVNASHLRRVMRRIGLLQLDSVNVVVRSHYLPMFSRLGPYRRQLLDEYAHQRRALFEYWGHQASLIPMEHYPLFRYRMADLGPWWVRMQRLMDEHPGYMDAVLDEVRDRGPLTVSDLDDPKRRPGSWWSWGLGKAALEYHSALGTMAISERRGFTRVYDIAERVIPAEHLDAVAPGADDAQRELLVLAARAHGIGTAQDLADYYRLPIPKSRETLKDLAASGTLDIANVEGCKEAVYVHPNAACPRRIDARALLSPFDSLVWKRDRTERLFGFHYRIEIYVPKAERVYGYYVLPFLLGERLAGRVDVKADRKAGRLLVRAAHAEVGEDKDHVASELSQELASLATWLDLDDVAVEARGDLASVLAQYLT